jgi:ATP-dependent Clp protease ATP-binding subunit ClpC
VTKPSFRVHLAELESGRLVGTLLRRYDLLFDSPPPSAFGDDREIVFGQLEHQLVEVEASGPHELDRYLWTEPFEARRVDVEVHAGSNVGLRRVIGARKIPLRLTTVYCPLEGGGYRVMLPRFGWWFVLEELEIAGRVVEQALASALLGENAGVVFDFRHRGPESVEAWEPDLLSRRVAMSLAGETGLEGPPLLHEIGEELVARAERNRLPRIVGTDPQFENQLALFEQSPPPSILLVGPSGVGKTTFVHRLAHHLLARKRGKRGEGRLDRKLWATSAEHIVAGMIYLGMWQDRVLQINQMMSHEGNYLYVDRLPALMAPQSDGASIADLMAPPVITGELSLIAEADERELLRCRQLDPSFVDCFRIIHLHEPGLSQLAPALDAYLGRIAPGLTLGPVTLRRVLGHLGTFRREAAFPGKAFQFFDWLARDPELGRRPLALFPRDASAAFSRYSGLPVELISDDVPTGAAVIAERLASAVIGQPEACDSAARILARFAAGLDDPERPVGNLFFVGPTGVGKTELARQIAGYLFGDPERLIRLDMSELAVAGSSHRLLEVGEGVTSLAERVRAQPLSVVLFDEIEKAHPEVFDLLLGILGEGRLTDSAGRLVDFRMAVIAMTSNLGARTSDPAGFAADDSGDYLGAVRRHFRPEFIGRLDRVIAFRALSPADIERIVDLELGVVARRVGLTRRNLSLRAGAAARSWLAKRGYDRQMGARPLKRLISDAVVAPLSVLLAGDPTLRDRPIELAVRDDRLELEL